MEYNLVYVTFNNFKIANDIGRELVKLKLVACVNIINNISSIYLWHDQICEDQEVILLAKTTSDKIEEVFDKIKNLHNYDSPCILSFKIDKGEKKYLKWIEKSVNHDISSE